MITSQIHTPLNVKSWRVIDLLRIRASVFSSFVNDSGKFCILSLPSRTKDQAQPEGTMAPFMVERASSISIKVLSQCAGAGIDLYANWVTMVLSKDFNLSVRGQRNINTALNNLPVYFTPERSL